MHYLYVIEKLSKKSRNLFIPSWTLD